MSILQVLARRGDLGVTDIAHQLAVPKSTVARLLRTLEARGMVEQTTHRGGYRLGYSVVQLAEGMTKQPHPSFVSRTVCDALAEEVGETVNVAVHEERSVVTIDQVIGSSQITTVNWVGQRNALHATAAGKVFLAHLQADELQSYLDEDMEQFTDLTIIDPGELLTELERVRDIGYGITIDEYEVGLGAVAAPVRDMNGRVIAALAVSGPTFRIEEQSTDKLAARVMAAASQVSQLNGHPKTG